jgi:hypothetical protein
VNEYGQVMAADADAAISKDSKEASGKKASELEIKKNN